MRRSPPVVNGNRRHSRVFATRKVARLWRVAPEIKGAGGMARPMRREGGDRARPGRSRLWMLLAALLLLFAVPTAAPAMEALQFFRIGTAAITGTYFQIGGVLASAISKPPGSRDCSRGGSCGVNGLIAVAQATQGSIQNVLAIASGQLEAGLVQSDVAYWAYSGA